MSNAFATHLRTVSTPHGPVTALVAQPRHRIVLDDAARLALRAVRGPTPADRELVEVIRAHAGQAEVFVFRACGDEGCWSIDPDLTATQKEELGHALIRGQLLMYRAVVAAGMFTIFGAQLCGDDYRTLKAGTHRMLAELSESPEHQVDCWLLKHLAYYTSLSVEQVLEKVLPNKVAMMRMRADKVREQLERLEPPSRAA